MQEQLVVWNEDAELLRRAATPRIEWFPTTRLATALRPLVWLLACVPILAALLQTPWSEQSAQWGLRSLRLLSVSDWGGFLDPGDSIPDGSLQMECPLMTWASAATMATLGPSHLASVVLPSVVCVFVFVVTSYAIANWLGGAWLGMLTAILIATHPQIQRLVHLPTCVTLGLVCSTISLWCFQRHIDSKTTVWSRWLLMGSIALGCCFLSNGPLTLVTLIISVVYVTSAPKCGTLLRRMVPLNRKAGCANWRLWKSLLVWLGLGLLVGGWWPLMMGLLHGSDFWTAWFALVSDIPGDILPNRQVDGWAERSKLWFRATAALMPLMTGFLALGIRRMWRIVWKNQEPAQRRAQHFLMLWSGVAFALWQLSLFDFGLVFLNPAVWTSFVVLPLSMLAAGGVLEIGERRAGFNVALGAFSLGLVVAVWRYRGLWIDASRFWGQFALVFCMVTLFAVSIWLTIRFVYGNEMRQRTLIRSGIWGLLLINAIFGMNLVRLSHKPQVSERQQPLLQFWSDLRRWRARHPEMQHDVGELVLMTSDKSLRLQYVVQSVWPRRDFKRVSSWDAIPPHQSSTGSRVIVTYGSQDLLLPTSSTATAPLVPIISSRIYRDGELTAYEMR